LVLVLAAAGYGIARGFAAEDAGLKYSACRLPRVSLGVGQRVVLAAESVIGRRSSFWKIA